MSIFYLRDPDFLTLSTQQVVEVRDDGAISFIPMSESNADYRRYLEWLAAGNTPEPWEATNGPV